MIRVTLLCLAASLCAIQTGAPAPTTFTLSGHVIGGSGQHAIHVALWDSAGFLSKPAQEIVLRPGDPREFHFEVVRGRWALSAFDDLNDNGKLDMGTFGPREPNGFWQPFHAWRKPRFDDVAAEIDRDVTAADIHLSGR